MFDVRKMFQLGLWIEQLRTNAPGPAARRSARRLKLGLTPLEGRITPSLLFGDDFTTLRYGSQGAVWYPFNPADPNYQSTDPANTPSVKYTNNSDPGQGPVTLAVVDDPNATDHKAAALTLVPNAGFNPAAEPNPYGNNPRFYSSEIWTRPTSVFSSPVNNDSETGGYLYGQITARIKVPGAPGVFPAFWMINSDYLYDLTKPPSEYQPPPEETDIFEFTAKSPNQVQGNLHGPGYPAGGHPVSTDLGEPVADQYHVYSINWSPDLIEFSVDGKVYDSRTPTTIGTDAWLFNGQKFNIILNLAAGGSFAGSDAGITSPQTMLVDYVRVFSTIPMATAVTPAVPTIAGGQTTFTLTVPFDSAMDPAVAPTISFGKPVAGTLTFASGAWSAGNTVYTATYNVTNSGASVSDIGVTVAGAHDAAGAVQRQISKDSVFSIAMTTTLAPVVTVPTGAGQAVGLTAPVNVSGSPPARTVVVVHSPNGLFYPQAPLSAVGTTTAYFGDANTPNNTKFTVLALANTDPAAVAALQNGQPFSAIPAGWTVSPSVDVFRKRPAVTSVTPSVTIITNDQNSFTLATRFNIPMDPAISPTYGFTKPAAGTLTLASDSWSEGNTVYTATYNVVNAGASLPDIGVTVTGARDISGGASAPFNQAAVFSISMTTTAPPTVTALTPGVATIIGSPASFTLTARFSAVMDTMYPPNIDFSKSVSPPLSFASGAWSEGNTVYTATYDVAKTEASVPEIGVTVTGARGISGTAQTAFSQNAVFSIAMATTLSPVVTVPTGVGQSVGASVPVTVSGSPPALTVLVVRSPNGRYYPQAPLNAAGTTTAYFGDANTPNNTKFTVLALANASPSEVAALRNGQPFSAIPAGWAVSPSVDVFRKRPVVISVTPGTPVINNTQTSFTLAAQFNFPMNTARMPAFSFSPAVNTTLRLVSTSWNADGTVFNATYNVVKSGVNVPSVAVTVTGGQDSSGAVRSSFTQRAVFSVALVAPAVTAVTPRVTTINNTQTGFSLAVKYGVSMNPAFSPTIGFNPSVAGTLAFVSGSWNAGNTIYTAVYTVTDTGATLSGVDVTVGDARGATGSIQNPFSRNAVFSIQMTAPTVSAVTPLVPVITAGRKTFSLTVKYSTAMSAAKAPAITFGPSLAGTLTFATGSWSAGNTLYTATYRVTNIGAVLPAVGVTVANARNTAGSVQATFGQNPVFSVAMAAPVVTRLTPSAPAISNALATFDLTAEHNTAMSPAYRPTFTFSPSVGSALTLASGGWNIGNTAYTAVYNVGSIKSVIAGVGVTVANARDSNGNLQTPLFRPALFSLSVTTRPVVSVLTGAGQAVGASAPVTVTGSPPALTVVVVLSPNGLYYVQPAPSQAGTTIAYFGDANTADNTQFTVLALSSADPALVTDLQSTPSFARIPAGWVVSLPMVVNRKR